MVASQPRSASGAARSGRACSFSSPAAAAGRLQGPRAPVRTSRRTACPASGPFGPPPRSPSPWRRRRPAPPGASAADGDPRRRVRVQPFKGAPCLPVGTPPPPPVWAVYYLLLLLQCVLAALMRTGVFLPEKECDFISCDDFSSFRIRFSGFHLFFGTNYQTMWFFGLATHNAEPPVPHTRVFLYR